jgi:hypothetical protein
MQKYQSKIESQFVHRLGKNSLCLLAFAIATPAVNYAIYFSIIAIITLISVKSSPPSKKQLLLWAILMILLLGFSTPKLLTFTSGSDLKEIAKAWIFITILTISRISLPIKQSTFTIFIILLIDALFTAMQWLQIENSIFAAITRNLHQEHHIEGSLALSSVRALGIFSDTAEHAAVVMIIYLLFLSNLRHKFLIGLSTAGAILSMIVLFAAQSKTGFIALLASLPLAYYCFQTAYSRLSVNLVFTILGSALFIYAPVISFESVEQYYRLFEYGLSTSSFDERQAIWQRIIRLSMDSNAIFMLLGAGRGALENAGFQSSVFDNDAIYILNTFGIFGIFVFLMVYFLAITRLLKAKSNCSTWLFYTLAITPLIGSATDFISSLKVLVLIAIISSSVFKEAPKFH